MKQTVYFSKEDLMAMEQRHRAAFVNSLSGFKSVAMIGSCDTKGQANLAIFNSFVHIGANPPYIGFVSRPDVVDRHTLSNIIETGQYTINHLHEGIYQQAHQTSARYPRAVSEFDATGLTVDHKSGWQAPFVKESRVQLAIQFKEQIPITSHSTILVVGEITQVYFPVDCLCEDGFLDIEKAGSIAGSGLDCYHQTHRLQRLSYAKPDQPLKPFMLRYVE